MATAAGWLVGQVLDGQRRLLLGIGAVVEHLRRKQGPEHLKVGVRGELEALFFLRRLGFVVVERRWRSPEENGDLDLVAWEDAALCFVEVKTRTARDMTPAGSAVDAEKQRMLARMRGGYLRTLPHAQRLELVTRFDVVSIYLLAGGVECELVRNAFTAR